MYQFNNRKDSLIIPEIKVLLLALSIIAFILLQPYFIWNNYVSIFRTVNILGNIILIYIIIQNRGFTYNIIPVSLFFIITLYTWVTGTENKTIIFSYLPILPLLFMFLEQKFQERVFNFLVTILAIVFGIGVLSYFLSLVGFNIQIGTAIALNPLKNPYFVYLGYIIESGKPTIRFFSIFDEPGVVGTLSGLILASIGISLKNLRSVILLLAGLISFSLAFYIILICMVVFHFNLKNILITLILTASVYLLAGDNFNKLIAERLAVEDGKLVGDNRTAGSFDEYYASFINKGGNQVIFGKGYGGYRNDKTEDMGASTYKILVLDYGFLGIGLIILFYSFSIYMLNNTKKGWFLGLICILSAYQRPDLLSFQAIVIFIGGLSYLKLNFKTEKTENEACFVDNTSGKILFKVNKY